MSRCFSRTDARRQFLFSFSLISLLPSKRKPERFRLISVGQAWNSGTFLLRRINTKWRCPVFCVAWWLRFIVRWTFAHRNFRQPFRRAVETINFSFFRVQLLHIFRHLTTRKEKSAKHAQLMLEIIGQMIKRVVLWKHKSKACYSPRPDEKGNEMVSFPS